MDFILMPADPERQRALPEGPHGGACAWRRNGTYPRNLVVLGRLSSAGSARPAAAAARRCRPT